MFNIKLFRDTLEVFVMFSIKTIFIKIVTYISCDPDKKILS